MGSRARAVDLVCHQHLTEHRALNEAEGAPARVALLQHLGTEDVRRHQIGRALDALVGQTKDDAQSFHELGLGEARHADQQRVAAGEQGDQGLIHHLALAENHAPDALPHQLKTLTQRLNLGEQIFCGGGKGLGNGHGLTP